MFQSLIQDICSQNRIIKRNYSICEEEITDADMSELEKTIKQQNEEYYNLYDTIAKNLTKKDQVEILKTNFQLIPDNKYDVCILFHQEIRPKKYFE